MIFDLGTDVWNQICILMSRKTLRNFVLTCKNALKYGQDILQKKIKYSTQPLRIPQDVLDAADVGVPVIEFLVYQGYDVDFDDGLSTCITVCWMFEKGYDAVMHSESHFRFHLPKYMLKVKMIAFLNDVCEDNSKYNPITFKRRKLLQSITYPIQEEQEHSEMIETELFGALKIYIAYGITFPFKNSKFHEIFQISDSRQWLKHFKQNLSQVVLEE